MKQYIDLEHLSFKGMSQAVRVGDIVQVSGQVAWGEDGELVGENDGAAQAEQCLRNLAAVLEKAGGGLGDVVKLTCFLTDIEHFGGFAAAKGAMFDGSAPASTTVVVDALLDPRLLMEVEAVAVIE